MNPEVALKQAQACDAEPRRSALHGIPIGIKDNFDTYDMPTEYGSTIYKGFRPTTDTACMGLFLSRGFSAARSFLPFFIFLVPILSFDPRREHSSAPTANLTGGRAQGRSRMAVTPTLPSTPLLPGRSLTGPSTAACCGDRVRLD